MLRTYSRVIALIAMVTCGLVTAQAAETTLTLACQGTVTVNEYPRTTTVEDAKPEPYSTGMIVNLTARTVQVFGSEYPFKIANTNDATIVFSHSEEQIAVLGSIDRVTGDMDATITNWSDMQRRNLSSEQFYKMKCRPAQRMF
jgi:hypothetical protein